MYISELKLNKIITEEKQSILILDRQNILTWRDQTSFFSVQSTTLNKTECIKKKQEKFKLYTVKHKNNYIKPDTKHQNFERFHRKCLVKHLNHIE